MSFRKKKIGFRRDTEGFEIEDSEDLGICLLWTCCT